MHPRTQMLCRSALLCALYVLLTYLAHLLGLASAPIQLRLSEALTILPYFTAAAIPGLTLGCLLSNLLCGCAVWDIVFGTLATLLGALGTRYLAKHWLLAPLFPILANMLIVPWVLRIVYGAPESYFFLLGSVGLGELLSCGLLGLLLLKGLQRAGLRRTPLQSSPRIAHDLQIWIGI